MNINYDQYGIEVHVFVARPTLIISGLSFDISQAESRDDTKVHFENVTNDVTNQRLNLFDVT